MAVLIIAEHDNASLKGSALHTGSEFHILVADLFVAVPELVGAL